MRKTEGGRLIYSDFAKNVPSVSINEGQIIRMHPVAVVVGPRGDLQAARKCQTIIDGASPQLRECQINIPVHIESNEEDSPCTP